ncbi:MAG TPA: type 1 glutamine amidotransferase [Fibrobacteria bacterium]|nr:type 1 glutamine amidotransferase [Fibrobacteria bacterium]
MQPQTSPSPRPLRVEVFQHVPFEGLGSMEAWFRSRGHTLRYTRLYAGESPGQASPAANGPAADWLIVMGGPMGVHDEAEFPWLNAEKRAIEAALARGAAVLGVCLGAQLLAHVLGAEVAPNAHKEIGWFPVELDAEASRTWLGRVFPPRFTPFHWHGDTFGIPSGAARLGSSQACRNQGFLYRDNALGLQFHPEMTAEALSGLVKHCGGELTLAGTARGRFVQEEAGLLAGLGNAAVLNALMAQACERLEGLAACP